MRTGRILILDDDPGIRQALQLTLELEGFEVLAAENGCEGLDLLSKNEPPCLIFLDLMMPVMNGWEFMQKIGENLLWSKIPVVAITAFAGGNLGQEGFSDVIKKPVDIAMILNAAKQYACTLSKS